MARSICIPVLSGHRCGSSAVAGVLFHLGVHMGPVLLGGSRWNPRGHFEDKAFVDLHKRIVGDWRAPIVDERPYETQYRALVQRRELRPLWGVKDPRLAFTFPFLIRHARSEIRAIRVHRDPYDIVASMTARGEQASNPDIAVGERGGEIAWAYESKLIAIEGRWPGPMLHVQFEELTTDPAGTVEMIADYVGVPCTEEAIAFVHPELRHNWRGHERRTGDVCTAELQAIG